ncbi:MAG: mucoidy inhibitor MuiA family protein [Ectothiorhodospira sp.]
MRPHTLPALGLFCIALHAPQALASRVTEVTVHPQQARVTVEETIPLEAGDGRIRLEDLPPGLDTDTLQVDLRGPRGLRIGGVETRRVQGDTLLHPQARALSDQIHALKRQNQTLEDRIHARQIQLRFIERLGQGGDPGIDPGEWPRAWEGVARGAATALEAIREHERQHQDLEARIRRLEDRLAEWQHTGRERLEALIHYESPEGGDALVSATYTVDGAGWEPVYEARLDTTSGDLELVQRARIRQGTGQDWDDVRLALSTARTESGPAPEPLPWYLDVNPQPLLRSAEAGDRVHALSAPARATESGAEREQTAFTAHYRVPGRVSIPSDNRPYRHLLANHPLQAELRARSVPRILPRAHLQARTTFDGENPLTAGPLSLFQDGALVRQTRLERVQPGDPLELTFGTDDRIAVTYRRTVDRKGKEGHLRPRHTLRHEHRIQVENGHDFPMTVVILDRMPVPRDERIRVEPGPQTTPPSRSDVDGRPGVVAWDLELPAGGQETLRFDYRISWPEELPGIQGLGQ